jgi:mRNA interferase MazF
MVAKKTSWPKRGEIYVLRFEPTIGSEIQKTRPALIIQNNLGNQYSATTIVAAITSYSGVRRYPTRVKIAMGESGLNRNSLVLLNQIRTVDTQRLLKKLGTAHKATMEQVDAALLVSLGLVGL